MSPSYAITFEAGETWRKTFTRRIKQTGALVDMTGCTARTMFRAAFGDATPVLSLTMTSGLTIDGLAGKLSILVTAAQTSALAGKSGVYDVEIVAANGDVTKLFKGPWRCLREVTI